jgi:VIT1/CCC1 family predicted Fe2+/Mn2+ transporter
MFPKGRSMTTQRESDMKEKPELKELETVSNHLEQRRESVLHPSSSARQEIKEIIQAMRSNNDTSHKFLLRVVQPGLAGLMDGSVSTLAPIFATAFVTHAPFAAFLVGMASATGAGISMAFSEGLSDDGELTGRGSPVVRGTITGVMTFLGGSLHTLPFLITQLQLALVLACIVVVVELFLIAGIRHRYFRTRWSRSIIQVVGSGILVFAAALIFGNA